MHHQLLRLIQCRLPTPVYCHYQFTVNFYPLGSSKAALVAQKQQQHKHQHQQQQQQMPSSSSSAGLSTPLTLGSKLPLASTRSKVNSILHLFSPWLIEAALTGVKVHGSTDQGTSSSLSNISVLCTDTIY